MKCGRGEALGAIGVIGLRGIRVCVCVPACMCVCARELLGRYACVGGIVRSIGGMICGVSGR